jgi:hypothetical protein
MPKTQFLKALAVQESAYHDFTHSAVIRAGLEVTETGVAVAQTIQLGGLPVGAVLQRAVASPVRKFKDVSDAAFNTTTLTVKTVDGAGADKTVIFTALELNENAAAEIAVDQIYAGPTTPAVAGDKLVAVLTGMAGKKLSELDDGKIVLLFDFNEPFWLTRSQGLAPAPEPFSLEEEATLKGTTVEKLTEQKEEQAKAEAEAAKKGKGEEADYEEKTVAELKDLASKRGVELRSDARKDEIIDALKQADKA